MNQCPRCNDVGRTYCALCGAAPVDEEELFDRLATAGHEYDERFGGRRSLRLFRRAGGYIAAWAIDGADRYAVTTIGRCMRMVDAFRELADALESEAIADRKAS